MAANERVDEKLTGRLDRRMMVRRAAALGLSPPALTALVRERAVAQTAPSPPVAPRVPRIFARSGDLGVDPYAWLENPNDPAVIAYLDAENAYRKAAMAPTAGLQESIYQELVGRIKQTDASVLTPWDGYLYYTRTVEGQQYGIVCRKQGSADAPEEILLDANAIAKEYLDVGAWLPSPDHRYLAYTLDETGEEFYTIYVKDLQTGEIVDRLPNSTNFEWGRGGGYTLLYCRQDDNHRPFQLYRHELGADPASDPLIYEEADEHFSLGTGTSKDRAYLFVVSSARNSTEIRFLPADQPAAEPRLFAVRRDGVRYSIESLHGEFLVRTDEDAPNFKLEAVPAADPAARRREVVPHRTEVLLAGFDVFADYLVLYGRERGFSQVWVRDLASGETRPIPFDEAVYSVGGGLNIEFATTKLRVDYSSLVTPPSTFEIDMATGERTLLKQQEIIGGHDPSRYVSERIFATAADGAQIPISLVRLREAPAGPLPLRLDAYGAYGSNSEPTFAINRLALINRGITYAIAHVRGGQEMGRLWWEEGRLLAKWNTFTDFIACADHLVAIGQTAANRLAIYGGSAGGMLIGVVLNERPDLFRAAVASVPAVDRINLLLKSPIGPFNRDEFGDPRDPTAYAYLRSWSPYDNVRAQSYPHIFATGGLNDERVPYWSPAKWIAKLRHAKTDDNFVLLRTEMGAGHGGVSGRYDALHEIAELYAFLLLALGLTDVPPATAGAATPPRAFRGADPARF